MAGVPQTNLRLAFTSSLVKRVLSSLRSAVAMRIQRPSTRALSSSYLDIP